MSNLKAYLAEKYMSGPKADAILAKTAPQKKKKRKKDSSSTVPSAGGAQIVDEDGAWPDESKEEPDDTSEAVVASDRGFKKRRVAQGDSSWVTVQGGEDGAAAIKQEEGEESTPVDEEPMVVDDAPFAGGLVTAKQLKKVLPQHHVTKQEDFTAEEVARAKETVYRDASGKKIDTKAARAEAARLKREREEQEAKKMEWGKGLVQREEVEKRRREMEKNRAKGFARYADDEDLNQELKEKEIWNDPAAAFLTKKKTKGPRKPEYTGPPPPPNRFGIKPGYRWDGVDRGNGFEKKLFQAQNSRKRRGAESYQWGVDDM